MVNYSTIGLNGRQAVAIAAFAKSRGLSVDYNGLNLNSVEPDYQFYLVEEKQHLYICYTTQSGILGWHNDKLKYDEVKIDRFIEVISDSSPATPIFVGMAGDGFIFSYSNNKVVIALELLQTIYQRLIGINVPAKADSKNYAVLCTHTKIAEALANIAGEHGFARALQHGNSDVCWFIFNSKLNTYAISDTVDNKSWAINAFNKLDQSINTIDLVTAIKSMEANRPITIQDYAVEIVPFCQITIGCCTLPIDAALNLYFQAMKAYRS